MASAGTVEIQFAAETAKFTAELKKVRGDLNTLKSQVNGISSSFSKASGALKGVFAALAVGTAIRAVVDATEESEAAVAQLDAALKSAGSTVGVTSQAFQAFATRMQQTSTFTDEAVIGVESVLLSFKGLSGPTILAATQSVLDLSTRMGVDLTSAAKLVGKALTEPEKGISELARSGVVFSEQQQKVVEALVKTHNTAGAAQLILKELQDRFGGAASAARDSFGGALKAVENSFGDLLEAKNGLPGATSALNELAKTLSSDEIKEGFSALVTGLTNVIELTAKGAAGLAKIGGSVGDFLASGIAPDSKLSAAEALRKELAKEQSLLPEFENEVQNAEKIGLKSGLELAQSRLANEKAFIETLKERIKLAEELQAKEGAKPGAADNTPSAPTIDPAVVKAQLALQEFAQPERAKTNLVQMRKELADEIDKETQEGRDRDAQEIADLGVKRLQAVLDEHDRELEAERQLAQQKLQVQNDFFDLLETTRRQFGLREINWEEIKAQTFVGITKDLFSSLASQNSKFAKAQQTIALAQTIWYTATGIANALRSVPFPANILAAAKVAAVGAIQIAKIKSTSFTSGGGEASGGIGIGGADGGTPSNPVFSDQGIAGQQAQRGASSQSVIQIQITGYIGREQISQMVDALKDEINERDVVIINSNSRQALEMGG